MDRESLLEVLRQGRTVIRMNNGTEFDVPSNDYALVSDTVAVVLYRSEDEKWRFVHLPLVTMAAVHPMAEAT